MFVRSVALPSELMQGRDPTPVLPRAATGAAASADQAARTELPAQAQQQEQQHSDGKRWRILVVVVGLGLGAMTDGPKQRVRELCLHHFAQGGSFCIMDEDSRANAALSFAACFFLADCIWCALVATPLYLRGGKDTLIGGVGELRRCWRRRRRRQAREKEKQTRQKGREAALEADRRVKRLKELELAVTSGAMRSKKPVRRRKGLQIQTSRSRQKSQRCCKTLGKRSSKVGSRMSQQQKATFVKPTPAQTYRQKAPTPVLTIRSFQRTAAAAKARGAVMMRRHKLWWRGSVTSS